MVCVGGSRSRRAFMRPASASVFIPHPNLHSIARNARTVSGSSKRLGVSVEAIADPWLGGYVFGIVRIEFDFLPQVTDKYAQVIHLIAIIGTPDCLQQFPMRHGLVRM